MNHAAFSTARRRLLVWAAAAVAIPHRSARADTVDRLVEALGTGSSFKVRVQAAALLGRVKDARACQALGRAAVMDPHPAVRTMAIRLLAKNPGGDIMSAQQARLAVSRALADKDPKVRKQAASALAELERGPARRGPAVVAVGHMGDRTGRASKTFRERMRSEIRALVGRESSVRLADGVETGVSFLVDGTIARLDLVAGPHDVEVACAVELVVSRPPRGIVTVASGEAVVQKPKSQFRPQMRLQLEEEALEHAVRSAHENLARFFAAQ